MNIDQTQAMSESLMRLAENSQKIAQMCDNEKILTSSQITHIQIANIEIIKESAFIMKGLSVEVKRLAEELSNE